MSVYVNPPRLDVLPAGETHLGEIGGNTTAVVVTPAIAAAAYSANDIVGGKLTLTSALRVSGGSGLIHNLVLIDASKQNAGLQIFIFEADLTVAADNAPEATSGADWLKCLGRIDILATDYISMANASVAIPSGFRGMPIKVASGTSLYGFIRTIGTPTYGLNALQLTFGILRD
jgi:hypothetical protein